jgi:transcriptional regulator with XRE-family HTH domain
VNASPVVRFCRCGTRLSRANQGVFCAACQSVEHLRSQTCAPDVPLGFWDHEPLRDALRSRHMGRVVKAFRKHPHHGNRALPQETVAQWMGITQAQLSRTETGSPITDIHKLTRWADVLKIPAALLWFIRDDPLGSEDSEIVKRSAFIKLAGLTAGAPSLIIPKRVPMSRLYSEPECAQWLAMELWQQQRQSLHLDEIPIEIAASLSEYVTGSTTILRDAQDCFSFAHPSFIDFYIAQQAFGAISNRNAAPFASMQTSHETDLVIREFVARDSSSVDALTAWMRTGDSPVLRVNSGGVLAKLGANAADQVIDAVMTDPDMRHLYLTAVISRVLKIVWDEAAQLAALTSTPNRIAADVSSDYAGHMVTSFAAEAQNPRDTVARWCSIVMLSQVQPVARDQVTNALQSALMQETSTLNLRSIGNVLAGSDPFAS